MSKDFENLLEDVLARMSNVVEAKSITGKKIGVFSKSIDGDTIWFLATSKDGPVFTELFYSDFAVNFAKFKSVIFDNGKVFFTDKAEAMKILQKLN